MPSDTIDPATGHVAPPDIPAGFELYEHRGPYFSALGPIYIRHLDSGAVILAVRVAEKHLNLGGVTHGGMLLTLADGAMSANLVAARTPRMRNVTVSMSSEFMASARPGDWLEAHVTLPKVGGKLAFADCRLMVGECCILHASGVFSVVPAPTGQNRSDG
nr:PaaI family thioesterase [Pseudomonas sp.]